MISYSRQNINEDDINAVNEVLQSDFLTTGPKILEFEKALCDYSNSKFCTALSSGTAALHAAMFAIRLQPGDEVIIPTITFVATANCIGYMGGKVVLCDIEENTLCIDVNKIEKLITPKTKAIICVDYAGQACDHRKLKEICDKYNLFLISDACHSMQFSQYADITCFSFHPVKHITTGEGGACLTNQGYMNLDIRSFRNHGRIANDSIYLGYNYRMTDIQASLGISQLKRINNFLEERKKIAKFYDKYLEEYALKHVRGHTYHLYVLKVENRDSVIPYLKSKGIGCQIHYCPIYSWNYYTDLCIYEYLYDNYKITEKIKNKILSIPIYPGLQDFEQEYIVKAVLQCQK